MNRRVLLVEPNYKNKYPPMGLMKISTYFKNKGDNVTFFKGDLKELVLNLCFEMLVKQLYANNDSIRWEKHKRALCRFMLTGQESLYSDIQEITSNPIILALLKYYRNFYKKQSYFDPKYRVFDWVGITTLFTFHWDITIETINFVKKLCKEDGIVQVGGVMASILPDRVEEATGIRPHVGTLDTPGIFDEGDTQIIDTLPLDYSILEEIDYQYPASDAYFAYMTRGCVNHCKFCAVPKLEPKYKPFLPVSDQVKIDEAKYGAKRNLLLLDNNVFASKCYNEIIDDIKKAGFGAGSTFISSNEYENAVNNLKGGQNDRGYTRACVKQLKLLLKKYKPEEIQNIYNLIVDKDLLDSDVARKEDILDTYDIIRPYFDKVYSKMPKRRYVDFNQGLDSRLVTDEKMAKLAEIAISPVRIAFDHWNLHEIYEKAIRCAVKYGHKNLSNYLLYNFEDKPLELYWRLKLNINLCDELDANIYSFPMKYHPIEDPEYFSNRDYIGKYWNRKYIRTIQAILNSTKGKVGKGRVFFEKAFGKDEEEFYKLLYMPEAMIIYRMYFENEGITQKWWEDFCGLSKDEKAILKPIVEKNDFSDIYSETSNINVRKVLEYYLIERSDAEKHLPK